ncbi:hypothetical protein [Facilibium subflavum]|nr:hypothetical protein [Facilibium subflavum]
MRKTILKIMFIASWVLVAIAVGCGIFLSTRIQHNLQTLGAKRHSTFT